MAYQVRPLPSSLLAAAADDDDDVVVVVVVVFVVVVVVVVVVVEPCPSDALPHCSKCCIATGTATIALC